MKNIYRERFSWCCGKWFSSLLVIFMSSFPAYGVSTGADGHKWTAWDDGIFGQYNSVDRNSPEAACRALYEGISRVSPWFAYDYIEESWGYKLEQRRSYVGVDLERERCVSEKHEDEYFWVSTGASGYWLNYNYIYNSRFGDVMRLGECADGYDKNRDGYCEPIRPLVKSCPISHPVFPGTGVKVLTERDESGSEELPLARTYRSHVLFGPKAGQGRWLFEWHREIDVPIAINGSESPQISVLRADGEVLKLLKTGSKWSAVGHDGTVERVTDGDVVTWRYTVHATGTVEIYNAKGRLQSVQAPGRRPTTLAYNKAEQLISVTAPSGRALKFDYDAQGNVASIIVPDGATTKYAYNTNGMLSTVTRPDNTTRQYVYEDTRFPTALTGVIDEAGVRYASYAYDDQGRAILSELTAGADRYQFQYGPDGQTTVLTPDGGSSVYSFLKQNGVLLPTGVSAPCPTCGKTSLRSEYDANGNVARKVAYDGTVTTFLYDADGRETQRVVGAGTVAAKTTNVEWHPTLRVPVRIASPGRIDSLTYDSAGRVTTYAWFYTDDQSGATGFVAAPADSITKMNWSYNSAGQVISVIETKGANETGRWSFTYDAEGNLRTVTNGAGKTGQAIAYDGAGRLLEAVDANNERIRYQYNSRGQRTLYEKAGRQTWYDYNALGLLTAIRGPGDFYMGYEYDAAHRLIAILRPATAVDMSFDENGVMSPFTLNDGTAKTAEAGTQPLWTRIWSWFLGWLGKWIGDAHAQGAMSRIDVRALPGPGGGIDATVVGGDPANVLDPTIGQRRDPSQVLRSQLGNALHSIWESIQGAVQAVASVCGMGDDANPDTGQRPSKTPNTGTPGSKHTNPGSGQERWYGDDGLPSKDIDHDHDHGQGVPHVHDWYRDANGNPVRGSGRPYDPKIDG